MVVLGFENIKRSLFLRMKTTEQREQQGSQTKSLCMCIYGPTMQLLWIVRAGFPPVFPLPLYQTDTRPQASSPFGTQKFAQHHKFSQIFSCRLIVGDNLSRKCSRRSLLSPRPHVNQIQIQTKKSTPPSSQIRT